MTLLDVCLAVSGSSCGRTGSRGVVDASQGKSRGGQKGTQEEVRGRGEVVSKGTEDTLAVGVGNAREGDASSRRGWRRGWLLVCGFALLVRFCTGLHPYSGMGVPPKYGDYEAQRHWMEVTLHTPAVDWYVNTTRNDLAWWGLDYPPLTAFQSLLHGAMLHHACPEAVALGDSRGFESPKSKVLMRWTVVLSDALVFFPAAVAFVSTFYARHPPAHRMWALTLILLQPAAILIDHGHFQYNCISLGFTLAACTLVCAGAYCWGSFFFCLAINHKHMSLYYAPAFFGHLLGRCLQAKRPLLLFCQLGATVVATFALCWWPFLGSTQSALAVLHRLVPLQRGLFEDHVANFWCVSSMLVKWKRLLPVPTLARVALAATVAAAAPAMLQQVRRPTPEGLVLAMLNSSFAFFFFAFQVHEKSILLPLLPASLLALRHPALVRWLAPLACFSMFPLLQRDGLFLACLALQVLFVALACPEIPKSQRELLSAACSASAVDPSTSSGGTSSGSPTTSSTPLLPSDPGAPSTPAGGDSGSQLEGYVLTVCEVWRKYEVAAAVAVAMVVAVLHVLRETVVPPSRLPYLHDALCVSFSFACFIGVFASSTYVQWSKALTMGGVVSVKGKRD